MAKELDTRRFDWISTVIGVTLSISIGVFFYYKTDLKAAFAVFAGLLGTTITLQVESISQARRAAEEAAGRHRLVSAIEAIDWMPTILQECLSAVQAVRSEHSSTMAVDLTRSTFETCLAELRGLRRGHYDTPFHDNWLVFAATERVRNTLFATSFEEADVEWWQSPAGQTYWTHQVKALARHVTIERTFIYRTWTEAHERLAYVQHESGVQTFRVHCDQLPSDLRVDMIIWDNQCGFEPRMNADGDPITNNFTFAKSDLAKMLSRYEIIKSRAEVWPQTP
jgi:hypothetical protein